MNLAALTIISPQNETERIGDRTNDLRGLCSANILKNFLYLFSLSFENLKAIQLVLLLKVSK